MDSINCAFATWNNERPDIISDGFCSIIECFKQTEGHLWHLEKAISCLPLPKCQCQCQCHSLSFHHSPSLFTLQSANTA
ncbi:hypothetical protein L6452_02010 [Arctium lappa]|uniref:Uncharacterized protein n=1 Tax=Arctium lappa TaxID=4217 RepID=A0ACB9FJQ5_ARCLA|nr:hypothetical protein L6452_02010 [Arctium lappa]